MKITVLCVGKIKEDFYRNAVLEYEKRLSRYCKFQIVEVADEKTPEHASLAIEQQIRQKEGERLLGKLKEGTYAIALAITGKMQDSIQMSDSIRQLGLMGRSDITFLIGGSLGLSKEALRRADETWSFSKLTFPHQLMRVILAEQIYRSYRIMMQEPYHK